MSYRIRGDLIKVYKFTHGVYDSKSPLELNNQENTMGHKFKLKNIFAGTSLRQNFANRITNTWNALSESIVDVPTVNCF